MTSWKQCNVIAMACVIAAGCVAAGHGDGWGWFLFVALLIHE